MSESIENTIIPKESQTIEATVVMEEVTSLPEPIASTELTAPIECPVDYETLLSQGKRNLMCGEIQTAVNQLNETCRLLASKFGDEAEECAEALLFYGTSLLELARMENSVLGNALQGMSEEVGSPEGKDDSLTEPDEVTEEEKKKISEEIIDAMTNESSEPVLKGTVDGATVSETSEQALTETAVESVSQSDAVADTPAGDATVAPPSEEVSNDESAAETKEDEDEEMEGDDEDEDTEEGGDATEDADATTKTEDEEVSNLQVAWETLELAKKIYQRQETKEARLKLADCHLRLGEVGLETEQYAQSIDDFRACLEILSATLEPTHRRLAETHYQVALACGFNGQYDDAVAHYRSAVAIIESRIGELRIETTTSLDDVMKNDTSKEIQDLESLIPDILTKIEDAEEEKSSAHLKDVIRDSVHPTDGAAVTTTGFGGDATAPPTSDAQPVHNVSHLVRKKRKPEEEVEQEEVKKAKTVDETIEVTTENSKVNGESKVNGDGPINGCAGDGLNRDSEIAAEKMDREPGVDIEPLPAKSVEDVKKLSESVETA